MTAAITALMLALAEPPITAAAFAPEGRVIVGSQAGLRLLSWPERKTVRTWKHPPEQIHDLVFSPTADVLAVAGGSPGDHGVVNLIPWPMDARVLRLEGHTDVVRAVAWSADGKRLVSASADGTCRIYDVRSRKSLLSFTGHAGAVHAVVFLPDGKAALSAGVDQSLRLWDTATGKAIRVMENHTAAVHALALRPGQKREAPPIVASGGADRTVRLWQPTIGRMMRFKRLPASVLTVAWTADGGRLLVGDTDGKLRILDPDSLDILHEQQAVTGWLYTLAVPSKGSSILVGGEKGQVMRIET